MLLARNATLPGVGTYSAYAGHTLGVCQAYTGHTPDDLLELVRIRRAYAEKRCIKQSSKQGYQWPHEKDVCPPKYKTKVPLFA